MTDRAELPSGHPPFYRLPEIAMLIALRVKPQGEEMRATIDKVRKRLVYAVDQDDLHPIGPPGLQLFLSGEVFAWARRKWPEAFPDVRVRQETHAQSHLAVAVMANTDLIPGDLDRCQATLRETYRTIDRLERELADVLKEAEQLRPLAERYKQNSEKNRNSAKRPRKV